MQGAKKSRSRFAFSAEEDRLLKSLIERYGQNWDLIASCIPDRNSRQCKDRYINYLRPDLATYEWTRDEDTLLIRLVETYGKKWTKIADVFGNRSEPMVKVRWSILQKTKGTTETGPQVNDMVNFENTVSEWFIENSVLLDDEIPMEMNVCLF